MGKHSVDPVIGKHMKEFTLEIHFMWVSNMGSALLITYIYRHNSLRRNLVYVSSVGNPSQIAVYFIDV